MKSLCMQVFFMDHSIDTERIVQHQLSLTKEKTKKLTHELLSAQNSKPFENDRLLKKIVLDIIVNNYLGNPSNQKVFCLSLIVARENININLY